MSNLDLQWLQRVVKENGRLLRVARRPSPGAAGGRTSQEILWTFDVGTLALRVGERGEIVVAPAEGGKDPAGTVSGDEDAPWWTLLGHPLTKASERADGALLVQFRADADSPKVLVLHAREAGVEVETVV